MQPNRQNIYRDRPDHDNIRSGRTAVYTLVFLNVIAFLLIRNNAPFCLSVPAIENFEFQTILTALFIHKDFSHIFFNMFALLVFGMLAAPWMGARRFIGLYFSAGIVGNLLWLVSVWNSPALYSLMGASGAVMGVTIAAAMLMPNTQMFLLFIPFPIKLKTLAVVFIALEFTFQFLLAPGSNIAFLAHIGGFIAGLVYMLIFCRPLIVWNPLKSLASLFKNKPISASPNDAPYVHDFNPNNTPGSGSSPHADNPVSQQELDFLLNKISRQGINSLTAHELDRLRQAREQMRAQSPR